MKNRALLTIHGVWVVTALMLLTPPLLLSAEQATLETKGKITEAVDDLKRELDNLKTPLTEEDAQVNLEKVKAAASGAKVDSCLQRTDAETECDFYADFYGGVELIGSNEFAEGFARAGLRLRDRLVDYDENGGVHFYMRFGLTSRNVQNRDETVTGPSKIEGRRAIEGEAGLLIDLGFVELQNNRLAVLGLVGFDSVRDIPQDTTATDFGPSDLFQHHFAGFRLYHTANDRYNGAFFDVGWGVSENFTDNEDKRVKFRGYLPIRLKEKDATKKFFTSVEVDSDFQDGEDEVKLIFGLSVEFKEILNVLSLGFIGQK